MLQQLKRCQTIWYDKVRVYGFVHSAIRIRVIVRQRQEADRLDDIVFFHM